MAGGRLVHSRYLSKHFSKLIRQTGSDVIHFHNLHQSYASMLLKASEHPKVVQELLGGK